MRWNRERFLACAVLAGLVLAAGCDRSTRRGLEKAADEAAGAAAQGPATVAGGTRFVFEDPAAQTVHLAGSFNNWSTSADPMTKDAQGRWTIVKSLPAGSHQYKFVVNGGQTWKADPNNPNGADDGYGGKNSLLEIAAGGQAAMPVQPQPAELVKPEAAGGPEKTDSGWRFSIVLPSAKSVHLAGSFNSWSTSADPMTKDAQGRWTLLKELPAGSHQYKFVVDGGAQWKEDPANPNTTDDGYGGKNSILVVP